MSFAALKKQSKASIDAISKKFEEEKTGGRAKDERYWALTVDKAGVGQATIRFLPPVENEEIPYVKRFEYFIKNGNRYYVNFCRSTLGEKDPMNEYFFEVRGDGTDKKRNNDARQYSRSTNYIANIYVVDDPAAPENNGKVFLFKFGSRIFQKLEGAIKPVFQEDVPFNPFNFWEGANFKLRAMLVDDQRSYEKSMFEACSPLFDNDAKLEAIWAKQFPLLPEISADKFKSYDELKKDMERFFSAASAPKTAQNDEDNQGPVEEKKPVKAAQEKTERKSEVKKTDDDDGDDFDKFKALLED